MDSKYITLFKELARVTAVSAEQVMDYDKEKGDETGFETAQLLRDDFQALSDKMAEEEFDGVLTRGEYAKLLVGALIMTNQINDRIQALKKALEGYQIDLIPKLQEVVDKSTNDDEAQKIAKEKFIVKEE